jgi:hypothetical protein
MTTFDEREKAFEAKYKQDEELRFKVMTRRDKLFGAFVGEQLGLSGEELEAYAKSVIKANFEKPGDADMVAKVTADLAAAGKSVSAHALEKALEEAEIRAAREIMPN